MSHTSTSIDLHFADSLGNDQILHAVTIDGRGWHLRAPFEGSTFTKHCHDWQSVERTLAWLRFHGRGQHGEPKPQSLRARTAAAVLAMALAAATAAFAQPSDPAIQSIQAFEQATGDYAQMHRRLEGAIGSITLNVTPAEINRIIQQLAAAIRAERPGARQGDLFTPVLANELRARINRALLTHGFTAADVRETERRDRMADATIVLHVNDTFPWVLGVAMFPCVVAALPPLPPELQYRIVGNDLILVDVHAGLIVDILPNALADLTVGILPQTVENPASQDRSWTATAGK